MSDFIFRIERTYLKIGVSDRSAPTEGIGTGGGDSASSSPLT